jgi:hypothetical protein
MKGKTLLLLLLSFCFIASSCFPQQYKPIKVKNLSWTNAGSYYSMAAEIINENENVGLYQTPVTVTSYDNEGNIVDVKRLSGTYGGIYFLLPKSKIIITTFIGEKEPSKISIDFPEIKWINFSNINIPKVTVSQENFAKGELGNEVFCRLTNESEYKLKIAVVIAFYSNDGKLFGGSYETILGKLDPKSSTTFKEDIFMQPPKDAKLVVKAYPTTIPDLEK